MMASVLLVHPIGNASNFALDESNAVVASNSYVLVEQGILHESITI